MNRAAVKFQTLKQGFVTGGSHSSQVCASKSSSNHPNNWCTKLHDRSVWWILSDLRDKKAHTLRPLFGSNRFNTRVLLKQLTEKFLVLRDKTLFKPIAAGQLGLVAGQLVAGQLVVEQLVVGQLVAGQLFTSWFRCVSTSWPGSYGQKLISTARNKRVDT